jgi:hypothetical protein
MPEPEACPYDCMWEDECWAAGGWTVEGYDCGSSEYSCCYTETMTCPYECYESEDACAEAGGWVMPEYSCDDVAGGGACCYVEWIPEPCPYTCVSSFICDWFGTSHWEYSCDSGVCCEW